MSIREQPTPSTQSLFADHWTRLILSYARHRRLFTLRIEDAEAPGSDWDEILRNERINRKSPSPSGNIDSMNTLHHRIRSCTPFLSLILTGRTRLEEYGGL